MRPPYSISRRFLLPLCIILRLGIADGYNPGMTKRNDNLGKTAIVAFESETSRRNLLRAAAAAFSTVAVLGNSPRIALSEEDDIPTDVYFGVGVSETVTTTRDMGRGPSVLVVSNIRVASLIG
jgi:hypothetical protein